MSSITKKLIVGKCVGKGFAEDEMKFMRGERCDRIAYGMCTTYADPEAKWLHTPGGRCLLASHYRSDLEVLKTAAKKINPLKASKRARKGK